MHGTLLSRSLHVVSIHDVVELVIKTALYMQINDLDQPQLQGCMLAPLAGSPSQEYSSQKKVSAASNPSERQVCKLSQDSLGPLEQINLYIIMIIYYDHTMVSVHVNIQQLVRTK